ncbi:hypothetical protein C0992_007030 [Termitomyces sp. T32_za158]|nr:hypothetical protein C0992_007030 [Termitomyces sp. T32_za158]
MYRYVRSASIAVTAFGAVVNLALAVQVFTASSTIKWEPESEWEASSESWQLDVVKVVWGLCCAHFTLAAAVCFVGFIGILKKKSSLVRFYRDYSIADFSLCALVTALASYAVFHASVRAATCEEISHHPELLRSLIDMGLNLENCERWLERGGLAFVVLMSIILVIRLHFLLAVSNMYSQLVRNVHLSSRLRLQGVHTARRIYLLPPFEEEAQIGDDVELVYAPIPISSIPKHIRDAANKVRVTCTIMRAAGTTTTEPALTLAP